MFDLEKAIGDWRRQMLVGGVKTPVPLEELESHLRDDVEDQIRSGVGVPQAFEAAVLRIGRPGALKNEFAKADVLKQALRRKLVWISMGVAFLSCWLGFGSSPALAVAYGVLLAGLVVATFIDFEHLLIPDRLSLGGVLLGLLCSLLLPSLHGQKLLLPGLLLSLLGCGVGAAVMYLILRLGKLAFGRQRLALAGETRIIFTDTGLLLPEKEISYGELFYRKSDAVILQARTVELAGRSYRDVPVCLTSASLRVGDDTFAPETVSRMEVVSSELYLPREAMGLGDVKLMAAIGAFLGWPAVLFSLLVSSMIGSLAGVGLIAARRREWSARLPYGPFIALAAAIWIFGGKQLFEAIFTQ
jgi:leader peptidase (prepilin peptidase)/N-methyltransferase